jgi:hypothetical protein
MSKNAIDKSANRQISKLIRNFVSHQHPTAR